MLKIVSPTGCVHAVDTEHMRSFMKGGKERRATVCNHADYYREHGEQHYHDWSVTTSEVTCKRCIASIKKITNKLDPDPMMGLVELVLTGLGKALVAADETSKAQFGAMSKQCLHRKPVIIRRREGVPFRCTNPKLRDPNFGWSCDMRNCPWMNRAMDWRANNIP